MKRTANEGDQIMKTWLFWSNWMQVLAGIVIFQAIYCETAFCAPQDAVARHLTAENKSAVVTRLGDLIRANYVFPELATRISARLEGRLSQNGYDKINDPREFALALTNDMASVAHDAHLHVNAGAMAVGTDSESEERDEARENFFFRKVERLPGNVGYLKLDEFSSPAGAAPTAIAALNFLANASAVIIDLRENDGGDPKMVQLICSYFFDRPTFLNSIYWRKDDRTQQFWTLPYVPGHKTIQAPLYVLTSNYTFSGAEEFAYDMKMLKRGKVIGEKTQGGANPSQAFPLTDRFTVYIPIGRSINPVSGQNWDGIGVEPDERVSATDALLVAHAEALKEIIQSTVDPRDKREAEWALPVVENQQHPVIVSTEMLQRFVGEYGTLHHIMLEDGHLISQSHDFPKRELRPLTPDLMQFIGFDDVRIKFISDGSRKVVGLRILNKDGTSEQEKRNN
jgi:retinol-binding protein 3